MPIATCTLPTLSTTGDTGAARRAGPWRAMVLTGVMARVEARVIECAAEGLVFHSDRAFPQGTRLKLLLALDDDANPGRVRPLTLPVRVSTHAVRGMAFCMHCRFDALDDQARSAVHRLLQQHKTSTH